MWEACWIARRTFLLALLLLLVLVGHGEDCSCGLSG
jgi:hypothetical protein